MTIFVKTFTLRPILLIALLLTFAKLFAQQEEKNIILFGDTIKVIAGCDTTGNKISCGNEYIQWVDFSQVPDHLLGSMYSDFINQTRNGLNPRKETSLQVISFGKESLATLFSFKKSGMKRYNILFKTEINGRTIIIYCGLLNKPKSNDKLPAFAKQFFTLNK